MDLVSFRLFYDPMSGISHTLYYASFCVNHGVRVGLRFRLKFDPKIFLVWKMNLNSTCLDFDLST